MASVLLTLSFYLLIFPENDSKFSAILLSLLVNYVSTLSVAVQLIQHYLLLKPSYCCWLVSKSNLVKKTTVVISISLLPLYHIVMVCRPVPLKIIRRYAYYILCFILHINKITVL